ncbi:unnamed protein product, partial [Meganyctiphanes norvegica]
DQMRKMYHKTVAKVKRVDPTGDDWVKIGPKIEKAMLHNKKNGKRKLLLFGGFPNRMHLLSHYQDIVRKEFYIKDEFKDKANSFFEKVSKDRGPNITYIGFHIRRGDYGTKI